LTFLAPYWLFAASAILVPIAIHLWNKRQGKTVKMGSVRWLEASASRRWSSITLHDVWLLLLRCLILTLLSITLAQPVLVQPPQTPESRKTIYIGQELLYTSTARQQLKPTIDSLLQRGYQLYTFTPDFAAIPQEQWQQISNSSKDSVIYSHINYWNLLPLLAEKHRQPQDSVWLFTSDQQRYFAGARPAAVPENIRWIPVASDATATWLQAAVQTSPDSLLLLIGNSSREGITYNRHHISATTQNITVDKQQLQLHRQADALQAIYPDKTTESILVQTAPLKIALLADEAKQSELRYLQAAINAISSYTTFPIHITTEQDTAADWIFWLRSNEVPPQLQQQVVQRGLHLWIQPATAPTAIKTYMTSNEEKVAVHQLIKNTPDDAQQAIWTTSGGDVLLTVQAVGKGCLYEFRTGFSPEWSDFGQSTQLPELLLPLLFPQQQTVIYDVRALDEQQLKPKFTPVAAAPEKPEAQHVHMLPWVVLAAFVLFLTERFIAARRAKV
jgi:hypothetical protein